MLLVAVKLQLKVVKSMDLGSGMRKISALRPAYTLRQVLLICILK